MIKYFASVGCNKVKIWRTGCQLWQFDYKLTESHGFDIYCLEDISDYTIVGMR